VQAETHTSADITLVTAEGDKVTLSTDAMLQAAYTRYDARGRLRGYGLEWHAETFQLASANDISLQIEGDLNDAERADIEQALTPLRNSRLTFSMTREMRRRTRYSIWATSTPYVALTLPLSFPKASQ
jgi:hypothetical protein